MGQKTQAESGRSGESTYATSQEVTHAIENLGRSDYAKLNLIARYFARTRLPGSVIEPNDLLHDAITKTLDGQRQWNKQVSIIKHLDRVMESDSGHVAEHRVAHGAEPLPECERVLADRLPDPSTRLSAVEELESLLKLFAHDKGALDLLRLKGQGFSPYEMQRELGIGKTQYESDTKRIRRHIAQHLTDGGH